MLEAEEIMVRKRVLSQTQFNRLRLLYAFDLGTLWSDGGIVIEALRVGNLNPDWFKQQDVLTDYDQINERLKLWLTKSKEPRMGLGCFEVRRTAKGAIVYANIARLKK